MFVSSDHHLPHPDHQEAIIPSSAEALHAAVSSALLERGQAMGDGIFLTVKFGNQRIIFNNYATSAAHSQQIIDKSDPNQLRSLKSGQSLITAEVHDLDDNTIQSYLICKPSDIRRGSLVASIIGQEFIDSLQQDSYTVLSASSAEEVKLTPFRLAEIMRALM